MQPYANLSGQSNVVGYENGSDYIKVQFGSGYWTLYTYTNSSAGSSTIAHMQQLARVGQGLNSFISTHKPSYANKC